jgi:hypothetical protein
MGEFLGTEIAATTVIGMMLSWRLTNLRRRLSPAVDLPSD